MSHGPKVTHTEDGQCIAAWERMGLWILQWGGSQHLIKGYTNENSKVRPRTLMRL